tara:strand:+ start:99 stop:1196 length:1098 start_codon:yes stop_codon:yes gene_type:complete
MKYTYFLTIIVSFSVGCDSVSKEQTTKPTLKDITELVYASANVVPQNTYNCRPSRSGIIEDIFIDEGDQIKKDQPLFSISATADVNNRLNNAKVNLQEAKDNLFGGNNKLTSIEIELVRITEQNQIDSSNYQRRKALWDQSIGSKNQLEQAFLSYQSSSSILNGLKVEYEKTRSTLQNQYDIAQNLVNTEQSLLKDLVIKSKIDGKVFTVFKETGEFISPQESFAEIGSTDDFLIELNFDEVDISKIEIGDTAIVHLEAYPDSVYTSTLSYISETKDDITQTFNVESIFTNAPSKLFNGLAGEANILVAKRKNAITIPSEYLIDGNKVLTSDGQTTVKIGVKSLEYVELLNGIDTSTVLLKPDFE